MIKHTPFRAQQQGFTLVEVLVTLVIFGFGMLGVAGLQAVSLSAMDTAQYRSIATLKASEMTDRLRANPGVDYKNITAAQNNCRATYYKTKVQVPGTCTEALMAADDLWDWQQEVAGRMPGGAGTVCVDSTPNDGTPADAKCDNVGAVLAVKVWWTDKPRSKTAVDPKRIVMSVVP